MPGTGSDAPPTQDIVLRGGCRCGNITYASTILPSSMGNCHCLACRQASGAPYLPFVSFPASAVYWTTHTTHGTSIGNTPDDSGLSTYVANPWARRGFCAKCGSTISLHDATERDKVHIVAGSIDEGSVKGKLPKPERHIFIEEKAGWFDLPADGLQRFDRFDEVGYDEKIQAWVREHGEDGLKS